MRVTSATVLLLCLALAGRCVAQESYSGEQAALRCRAARPSPKCEMS